MFFAAVIGPEPRLERARSALALHGAVLGGTGWSGELIAEGFAGGLLAWDHDSSHVDLFRDAEGGSVLLRGGYLAGEDGWDEDGRHSTEREDAWGEFAAITVRGLQSGSIELKAFSDPAASWPIYFARRDSTLAVSNDPHFIGLALGLSELSSQAAYELIAYHHSLGTETTIKEVVRLYPGDQLLASGKQSRVEQCRVESRPTYAYALGVNQEPVSGSSVLDALRNGVAAIRPLALGGFARATLQLSGGLDSRLTAATLANVFSERPDVVTLDLSDEVELGIAREVATRLGYPHRTASLAATDLTTMRAGWLLTAGQVSPYAAAGNILSYETAARANDGQILLVGAWPGDCLIGSYIPLLPGMASRVLRRVAMDDWADKRGKRLNELAHAVSGPGARKTERTARRRLRQRLRSASGSTAAQSISYWAMFSRQPAFSYVAPAMLTSHVLPITPVLARPYVEQLLRLNARQVFGKNFYRAMILHGFPVLADVPTASSGRPVTDSPARVRWIPTTINDLYVRLPTFVQRLSHSTIGRLRPPRPAGSGSAESNHWEALLLQSGEEGEIQTADGVVIRAGHDSDAHVRAVSLGLRWTKDYLEEGTTKLGAW